MSEFVHNKGMVILAVGTGVLIGATSVYLYQQLFGEHRRRILLQKDVHTLGISIAELRKEIALLRATQGRRFRKSPSMSAASIASIGTDHTRENDMYSVYSVDESHDEFYDLSSDENTIEAEENENLELTEIDALLSGSYQDLVKAHFELQQKSKSDPEVLWRLAKACHLLALNCGVQGNDEGKQVYITKGLGYAEQALKLNENCSESHKWYAICIGERGQFSGKKEKIKDGYVFKDHIQKAIDINPADATLYHLLGRFKYEVSSLSWVERNVAKALFGEVPSGSFEETITSFQTAEKLSAKPWKENRLLLAKTYIQMRDYQSAIEWLDKAEAIPPETEVEKALQQDIQNLINKYSSYRVAI